MNQEQVKTSVRWVITTFGGGLIGFVVGKGWVSQEVATQILTSEAFIGAVAAIAMWVWSLIARKNKNIVAAAAALPDVKGVITNNTPEGRDLAESVPAKEVVAANTVEATKMVNGDRP